MVIGQVEPPRPVPRADPALYLIAMCDVLGFSRMMKTRRLAEVYDTFVALRAQINGLAPLVGFAPRVEQPLLVLDAVMFSDTVLFWAPATGAMEVIAMNLCLLMSQALKFGLPLRVGLAFGECVIDSANDIYIGKPIVDAYETETRQAWMGGAYHPSCWNLPGFRERLCEWRTAIRYDVPVKLANPGEEAGPSPEYALNWTLLADDDAMAILNAQKAAAPAEAKDKWDKALDFYQFCHR